MPLSPEAARDSLIAFQRFGLGPKPGGFARIGADPRAALRAEVNRPGVAVMRDSSLPSYAKAAFESQSGSERSNIVRRREVDARMDKHLEAEIGFVERLVLFWSNHFSLSVDKGQLICGTAGQLERDVIRKHVLGNFTNMLVGVMTHPAMVFFLDNADSVGPNSITGLKHRTGFNENLAREIMELHTVGSGAGYTQADVSAFTNILTGWSYVRGWEVDSRPPKHGATQRNRGQFIYRPDWHEPGAFTVMGKTYQPEGVRQGIRVLHDLARHPATAEHIAFKLVRHFIADEPTPAMVNPVRKAFLRSRGNLKKVALALLNVREAWSLPLNKIRTPYEYMVAQFRALESRHTADELWVLTAQLRGMQNMIWECPSVEGYSDETAQWLTPDGMRTRLDSTLLSVRYYGERLKMPASDLAKRLFGPTLSAETRERIAATRHPLNALIVLFLSPEFQRR